MKNFKEFCRTFKERLYDFNGAELYAWNGEFKQKYYELGLSKEEAYKIYEES